MHAYLCVLYGISERISTAAHVAARVTFKMYTHRDSRLNLDSLFEQNNTISFAVNLAGKVCWSDSS